LGVWGVTAHHPLGLELDLPENVFHLTAGPLALILGLLNLLIRDVAKTPVGASTYIPR
jgi:hypothetical protein